MELETKEIQKDEMKFVRDLSGQFVRFKWENAASRIIQMMSEVFSPNGDEKSGVRDKWSADCHRRRAISYISDYKDNRFNAIFRGAAELIHHLPDMVWIDEYVETLNLKLQSILLDLETLE